MVTNTVIRARVYKFSSAQNLRSFLEQTRKMDNNGVKYSSVKNGSYDAEHATGENQEFVFKTPFYGRDMIRMVQVERNGKDNFLRCKNAKNRAELLGVLARFSSHHQGVQIRYKAVSRRRKRIQDQ